MRMAIPTVDQFAIDYYWARNMASNKSLSLRKMLLSSLNHAMNGLEPQSLGTYIPGEMGQLTSTRWEIFIG